MRGGPGRIRPDAARWLEALSVIELRLGGSGGSIPQAGYGTLRHGGQQLLRPTELGRAVRYVVSSRVKS